MKQDEYSTARPEAGATEIKQLNPDGPDRRQSIKLQPTQFKKIIIRYKRIGYEHECYATDCMFGG